MPLLNGLVYKFWYPQPRPTKCYGCRKSTAVCWCTSTDLYGRCAFFQVLTWVAWQERSGRSCCTSSISSRASVQRVGGKGCLQHSVISIQTWTEVALAFEQMRTPYASGLETCVRNLGNAYQQKQIEKRLTHFQSTFPQSPAFLRRPYASLPWFCVQPDFYA